MSNEEEEETLELHEEDILEEFDFDEEDVPEADDEDVVSDVDEQDIVSDLNQGPLEADKDTESESNPAVMVDDSVRTFSRHTGELYCVACSPTDDTLVATGGEDDRGFLWKVDHTDWEQELKEGHEDSISSLAFSKDGLLLATGSLDGVVQVWNMPSGSLKCTFDDPEKGIQWVSWHPREHWVLAGTGETEDETEGTEDETKETEDATGDGTVWLWCCDSNMYLNTFICHSKSVTCGDFTPDGNRICTGSDDASLRIWSPITGQNLHVVKGHRYHTKGLTCMSLRSDSTLATTGSQDGSVCIVNIVTGQVLCSLESHSDSVEYIGLSDRYLATAGLDGTLVIWDLESSSARCTCEHEGGGITCLAWLGSSPYVVTGGLDGRLLVWNSLSGECVKTFSGHSDSIFSLSISANLNFLVSVSSDKTARVFDIREFTSGTSGTTVNGIESKMSSLNLLK